jgi:hypothetical protein
MKSELQRQQGRQVEITEKQLIKEKEYTGKKLDLG